MMSQDGSPDPCSQASADKSRHETPWGSADLPHSLVWRGGAIHFRSEGIGKEAPDLHSHFAIQLSVGLTVPLSLRRGRRTPESLAPGWVVGSDQPHLMRSRGAGLTILLDPLSENGRRLAGRLCGADSACLSSAECEAIRSELEGGYRQGWQLANVQTAVGRILDRLAPKVVPDPIDPRVRLAVDMLLLDPSETVSLADLAARVGLSESRLAHLFRQSVGMPMRQYRLSLRMEQAVKYIARGSSVTEAAHMAGFSDSAHFCRICRRMFGGTPSNLPRFSIEP